jgi:hypothetical protein
MLAVPNAVAVPSFSAGPSASLLPRDPSRRTTDREGRDSRDRVFVVEANLDDVTGETVGHSFDRLRAAGAVDVYATPIQMKKNRPGVLLSALVPPERVDAVEEAFLVETSTLGVRRALFDRRVLPRRFDEVRVFGRRIRRKIAELPGGALRVHPEYDDCRRAAAATGRPFSEIANLALAARAARPGRPTTAGR